MNILTTYRASALNFSAIGTKSVVQKAEISHAKEASKCKHLECYLVCILSYDNVIKFLKNISF